MEPHCRVESACAHALADPILAVEHTESADQCVQLVVGSQERASIQIGTFRPAQLIHSSRLDLLLRL